MKKKPKDGITITLGLLSLIIFAGLVYRLFQMDNETIVRDFGNKFTAIIYFGIASPLIAIFLGCFFGAGAIFQKMGVGSSGMGRVLSLFFAAVIFFVVIGFFISVIF